MTAARKPITPEMKVGEFLDAYPELEETLTTLAPAFEKLRNPVLRRTVARVTSLAQAARVGGVAVAEMVNVLRRAAGQAASPESVADGAVSPVQPGAAGTVDRTRIWKTLDARPLIEQGEQPIGRVLGDLKSLPDGMTYELITSFEPAPLIDKARDLGFTTTVENAPPNLIRTYFTRLPLTAQS